MRAYVFPGQGAQFPQMGKDLYERHRQAAGMFEKANKQLGFRITDLMFEGTKDDLKQTRVTQPAIFLHSVILASTLTDFDPGMVAGHSLGEFSALVACGSLSPEDGLSLVYKRAQAMQKACEKQPSTMAAIIGMEDKTVEDICNEISEVVVPANYNSPGQIVISGSVEGIDRAIRIMQEKGARKAVRLNVGGAFHSPLMESAGNELREAIHSVPFHKPCCPVYQNVTAIPTQDPELIKENLIAQLTSPVKWTQSVQNMIRDGASVFTETGPGKVLQGLIRKIDRNVVTESA